MGAAGFFCAMRIPTVEECYRLVCKMGMMDHIVGHSIRVCQVAAILVDGLLPGAGRLDRDLVRASALLHDITKTRSFETRENHARTGEELLCQMGYPEVGRVVGQHVVLDTPSESGTPTEAEIVNYADKRVLHEKVVSLKERMDDVVVRYGVGPAGRERIRRIRENTQRLEAKLFGFLPFPPKDLNGLAGSGDYDRALRDYSRLCGPPGKSE